MTTLLLALTLPTFAADLVHTRDGRKIEGRVLDYERFVEVEPAEGKKVRVPKAEILKIDLSPNYIHNPETVPFPIETLERGQYDYYSFQSVLVCVPQPPARKVVAFDVVPARKIWDLDLPNRSGDPVLGGRTIHFLQREKEVDDTKKYKVNGTPFSKEIHRLTATALDITTGERLWSHVFDNNDGGRLMWEYSPYPVPSLHVLPDRVVIRAFKTGYPIDASGNVDKNKSTRYVTFVSYDPEKKKVISSVDSVEATETGGRPWFTEETAIAQVTQGGARWKLISISLKDGKLKWQSDLFPPPGKLFEANDEYAYVMDSAVVSAFSVKTGKKLPNWAFEYTGGRIADFDYNFVYLYRTQRAPRAILAYDVKKGAEAWRIPMPDADEFNHLFLAGHRLIYTDKSTAIHAWDTLQKKEMWKWTPAKNNPMQSPRLQGRGLSFYKDGLITTLDVETGDKLWEIKHPSKSILQVGDAGIIAHRMLAGADVIHERRPPKNALFFTPTGTPLRFALVDDAWSLPAVADGRLYSISGSGRIAAVDLHKKEVLWTHRVASNAPGGLWPPVVHGKRIAFNLGQETVVLSTETKTRECQVRNVPLRPDRQAELYGKGILTTTGTGLALVDLETGQSVWECAARAIVDYAIVGDKAYVLTATELLSVDLKTGSSVRVGGAPPGATALAVDGKLFFVASGPFALGVVESDGVSSAFFKAAHQDAKIALKFRGAVAAAGGHPIFSHADGDVTCFKGASEEVLWRFPAGGPTSSLLVNGDTVSFAAAGQGLFSLEVKTGKVAWKTDLFDASNFTPFLLEGKLAFWSCEGWAVRAE